jgi:hypothetical protein
MKKIFLFLFILIVLGVIGHFTYDDKEPIQIGNKDFDVTFQKTPNQQNCLIKIKIISKENDYNVRTFLFKIRDSKNTVFDIYLIKTYIKKNIPIEESKILNTNCTDIQKPIVYIPTK